MVLPTSEFKAHTSLLILGLCFLIEVSTIYIDIGMYKKLVMSIDIMIPYIVLGSALVSRAPFAPPSESRARALSKTSTIREPATVRTVDPYRTVPVLYSTVPGVQYCTCWYRYTPVRSYRIQVHVVGYKRSFASGLVPKPTRTEENKRTTKAGHTLPGGTTRGEELPEPPLSNSNRPQKMHARRT